MAIELIAKIAPKNDGFTGMVDADQIIAEGTLLDACLAASNVLQFVEVCGITFVIDGGGGVIETGLKMGLEIPFACTITQATLIGVLPADTNGSIVIDIWKDIYANCPPTDADSITASAPPTITTAKKSQDATLTGWTKTIAAGDILFANVDSCSTFTAVTLSLKVERT